MDFFSILTLLGGLAMFLYGMQVMGDGLAKVSGGKLEQILENLTSSKWKAVLLGMCVTAVIQSSSATTVMVVGFVNSGIMKLTQAVGIIMGANIGTTITSWILSLTGIESSNFFISLLKPTSFSPILALIGVVFIVFLHDEKKKDIDEIDGNQCKQDIIHPFQHIAYLRILGTFPGSPRDIPGQKNIDKDNQAQQQPGILHPKREKQVENGCYAEFNPLFLGKLLHLFLLLIKI